MMMMMMMMMMMIMMMMMMMMMIVMMMIIVMMMMMMIIISFIVSMYACMYAVLGPTDPEKAPAGSLRNMMFLDWQSLGQIASQLLKGEGYTLIDDDG